MGFLSGKRIVITGIASNHSIAYGIAKVMYREGASLAFSYQNNRLKERIEKLSTEFESNIVLPCDVSDDKSIETFFVKLSATWENFDGFIHAIAYSPPSQLQGDFIDVVNRQDYAMTHDISAYSFVAMAKISRNMLVENASLVTLTYLGSERAIPYYNVMGTAKAALEANTRYLAYSMGRKGIRVNAISAGPIRTVAASGIKNFKKMLSYYKESTPLRRSISLEEIGNVAAFLCSDLSSGITGEIIHVDGGFNITAINIEGE
ncbi:SDR family oxidoreductase [Candidatus Schneideria nysicola]|uniref:enoyl-ACP reductase FabI n=1 Tax=Candidatus Schneideria nysicola TaxID=1081631 RepID=UPI001CAA5FED|nr:SDR family oxidoreductase [Candidatus Schneideria nysicola]UAJ65481.1 SDR family oxidoreductase [Candidatus Schneideria nysicola]